MRLQNVHPLSLPSDSYSMGGLYALSPFKPISIKKSLLGVGDFQVAIGGGFWVAIREVVREAERKTKLSLNEDDFTMLKFEL